MAEKRVIEYEAASELANDDWLLIDGVTEGTRKARSSTVTAELGQQVTNIATAVGGLTQVTMGHEQSFAPSYDESTSYDVGDLVMKYACLYKCTAPTTGTWDSSKWQLATVAEQLEESGKIDDVQVNGISVVTDKVANIDLTDMQEDIDSKVADATVADQSILDENHVLKMDSLLAKADLPTGAISTITDGSNLPMPSLTVGIEATQEGSGDPSPTNVRPITGWSAVNLTDAGKNLFDISDIYMRGYGINSQGEISASENYNLYRLRADNNTAYTVAINDTIGSQSRGLRLAFYSKNNELISVGGGAYQPVGERVTSIIQGETGVEYLYISVRNSAYDVQLEIGDTSTAYEAYNGTTTPIAFTVNGETKTIYGGYVEVVNGKVKAVATDAMVDMGDLSWSYNTQGTYPLFQARLSGSYYDSAGIINTMCSTYKSIENQKRSDFRANDYNNCTCITNQSGYNEVLVQDSNYTDETAFKTAVTGQQLIYTLFIPIEYDLADVSISTQDGINNIWADTGDVIEGGYYRNVGITLNDIISRVEALENA